MFEQSFPFQNLLTKHRQSDTFILSQKQSAELIDGGLSSNIRLEENNAATCDNPYYIHFVYIVNSIYIVDFIYLVLNSFARLDDSTSKVYIIGMASLQVHLRFAENELHKAISEVAKRNRRSLNQEILRAIEYYLEHSQEAKKQEDKVKTAK